MDKNKQKDSIISIMRSDEELGIYERPSKSNKPFKNTKLAFSKDYQIGHLIGQLVVPDLPTLSSDSLKSRNVIVIPENLEDTWKIKEDEWFSLCGVDEEGSNTLFNENLKWYRANIEKVFLPREIEFVIRDFYSDEFTADMEEGFKDAIWDCDLSHYRFDSAVRSKFSSVLRIYMKYGF